VAKLSRDEREAIAEKRLLSVLATATIANQRTLEQKISDAGPYGQRVDPHVLTDVRKRLMKEGIIGVASSAGSPWFFASNTSKAAWEARLQILLAVYQPYLAIAGRIGQALEIATYRALSEIQNADFEGRFKELDGHDDSTMYKKSPRSILGRAH
jgi:hypothetical protein